MKKDIGENSSSTRLFSRLKTSKQYENGCVFDEMIAILAILDCKKKWWERRGLLRGVCKRLKYILRWITILRRMSRKEKGPGEGGRGEKSNIFDVYFAFRWRYTKWYCFISSLPLESFASLWVLYCRGIFAFLRLSHSGGLFQFFAAKSDGLPEWNYWSRGSDVEINSAGEICGNLITFEVDVI